MNLEDSAGKVVSGCIPAALEHLEMAQHQLRCFIGDPVASVNAALGLSPDMAMGHLLPSEFCSRVIKILATSVPGQPTGSLSSPR